MAETAMGAKGCPETDLLIKPAYRFGGSHEQPRLCNPAAMGFNNAVAHPSFESRLDFERVHLRRGRAGAGG